MKQIAWEVKKSAAHQLVRCLPRGICSWDFRLESPNHRGDVQFGWGESRGSVLADGKRYTVNRQGFFSGCWQLSLRGKECWRAEKPSVFGRDFVLSGPDGRLFLQADSLLGRSFSVFRDGRRVAHILPEHPFTRRATIELRGGLTFVDACFAFWLVALLWRRAQSD